jgi:hypothetical protein
VTISDIVAKLRDCSSSSREQLVAKALSTQGDFHWLDKSGGWFWFFPAIDNRILLRIEKILAVANRIAVSELHQAVSGDRRLDGASPPKKILLALCAQLPWCRLDNDSHIVAITPPVADDILSKSERALVRALKDQTVIRAADLKVVCAREGIERATMWHLISSSPIVVRPAYGVYTLVGERVDLPFTNSLLPPLRSTSVLLNYCWHANGSLWLGFKISQGMIRNGVFGVPTAMRKLLHGKYTILASGKSKTGILVLTGTAGWGLGPFLRRRKCKPGDLLVICFDVAARIACAHLEGEDLLDEFRSLRTRGCATSD